MIAMPPGVRVWIATGHTDMRRGMNTLALLVQEAFKRDPHGGDLYVFRGKSGKLIKILWHDGRRSRTASFRSRCRNSLTCSRASIGAIRYTLGDPRRRAECGVLTHRGKLSLRITRDYDSVVAWRRQLIPFPTTPRR
jgi:transposase